MPDGQIAQPSDVTPAATGYPAGGHLRRRRLGHRRPLRRRRQPAHQLPEQRRLGLDGQRQPRRHHRPRHHPAQRPLRHQRQPARNDELRAGARLRPRSRSGLLPGQPRRASERRARRHAGLAGDAAAQRRLRRQPAAICIPNPAVLRYDDIAALNRIYPITAAESRQLSRQAAHRRQHRLHSGHDHLPHRRGHAGRQRGRPPARRQRQPPLPVHGHLRLRRLLQRQPRQPRHRLHRRKRQPAHHVGLERSRPAGLLRPERNPAAAGHDHGQLPGHL